MESQQKGILYAVVTAFLWGFLAIALKIAAREVEPITIVWFRFAIAFSFLFVYNVIKSPKELKIFLKPPLLLVVAALALAWNYMGFMLGIHYTSPSNAQVAIQTGPIILALVGVLFFKEKIRLQQIIGFALAAIGLLTFYNQQIQLMIGDESQYNIGFLLTISGALAWAIYAILQKKLVLKFAVSTLNIFLFGLPVIIYFPLVNFAELGSLPFAYWLLLLFLGLNTLIAYGSIAMALRYLEASKVSVIVILNPIITFTVMGILAYLEVSWINAEKFSFLSIIGAIIVLSGAILVVKRKTKR